MGYYGRHENDGTDFVVFICLAVVTLIVTSGYFFL